MRDKRLGVSYDAIIQVTDLEKWNVAAVVVTGFARLRRSAAGGGGDIPDAYIPPAITH
jgi:hypothetical protein